MKILKIISKILICIFALIGASTFLVPVTYDCYPYSPCKESAAYMSAIKTAIKMFVRDMGRFPTSEEGLSVLVSKEGHTKLGVQYRNGGYIERIVKDPWGAEYQYAVIDNGKTAIIWSSADDSCYGVNLAVEIELFSIKKQFGLE